MEYNNNGPGTIIEFSLAEPAKTAPAMMSFQSTLVHTIIANQWNPPSPDTAGITYMPDRNGF